MAPLQIPTSELKNISGGAFEATIYDAELGLSSVVKTPFTVECDWYMEGPSAGLYANAANSWRLQVAFESIGGGPEGVQASVPVTIPMTAAEDLPNHPGRFNYSDTVTFTTAVLPAGTYHLTAILTGEVPNGAASPSMAAYQDLGVIHVVP
jgi:hypothetical protein